MAGSDVTLCEGSYEAVWAQRLAEKVPETLTYFFSCSSPSTSCLRLHFVRVLSNKRAARCTLKQNHRRLVMIGRQSFWYSDANPFGLGHRNFPLETRADFTHFWY
jgi:hypothetical protein